MEQVEEGLFSGFNVVIEYSREMLLEDGSLINVSEMAREAGFVIPVAITAALRDDIEAIPDHCRLEDIQGRLWDVLWMASIAVRRAKGRSELTYDMILHVEEREMYRVKAMIGPGDDGEPVITLMKPDEN